MQVHGFCKIYFCTVKLQFAVTSESTYWIKIFNNDIYKEWGKLSRFTAFNQTE